MMSPVDRLLRGMRTMVGRRWGAECPADTPVPDPHRCSAVGCDSVRLTTLSEGEQGRVTCLEDPGSQGARTLAVLGILPGVELELLQRSPVFVFRIGHSEFALDAELAGQVRVRPVE